MGKKNCPLSKLFFFKSRSLRLSDHFCLISSLILVKLNFKDCFFFKVRTTIHYICLKIKPIGVIQIPVHSPKGASVLHGILIISSIATKL